MFTQQDLQQIEKHGLTPEAVELQLENFRRGFPFLNVVRAASPGDGVLTLSDAEAAAAAERYERAAAGLSVVKFVPASGAATRMFKELFEFVNDGKRGKGIDTLLENIGKFAFWPELKALLPAGADDRTIVSAIVNEGLGYGRKPKGLVTFHAYPEGARKAVEEHLVEGAVYAAANGVAKIHFTVSPEHIEGFQELLAAKVPVYEKRFGIRYDISFSVQKPSTDTIAVNPDNTPFRQDDGTLLFRPAGHGALIENLNEIDADVVFIKNIDNVTTDAQRGDTIRYKKVLAGITTRSRQGKFCGGTPPFGLMRDPEDKGHLIIDPETAPIIRKIYDYALDGLGCMRISKRLMEEKIPITHVKANTEFDANYYSWGGARTVSYTHLTLPTKA